MAKQKNFPKPPVRPDQGIRVDGRLMGRLACGVLIVLGLCALLAGSTSTAAALGGLGVLGFFATPVFIPASNARPKDAPKKLRP
ncbi:MAG: hypothetical protein AB1486_12590 [Planctomycetota bacterium]